MDVKFILSGGGPLVIHVAVVEDEKKEQALLQGYLNRFSAENNVTFEVDIFSDPVLLLDSYQPIYDIIYMDIQMPHINGMEAARRLRALDQKVLLVFVTNLTQYAIEGYEVSALDYVLKPVQYYSFAMKLTRALWRVEQIQEDALNISTGNGTARVNLRDVKYIEVRDHLLTYYTIDGSYSELGALSKLEQKLIGKGFARCSSSCIVNLKYASGVKGYRLSLSDGTELRISQPRKKRFMAAYQDYFNSCSSE